METINLVEQGQSSTDFDTWRGNHLSDELE